MKVKRWSSVVMVLMLCTVVVLAGCSGSKGNSNNDAKGTEPGEKTETNNPSQASQDTLIVGRGGDSASLDPAIVTDGESLKITHQVFDSLLEYKEGTTEVQGSLAESWTVSEDGLTYTFKLRQGVTFHDGTEFNADAVVFNFTRWTDPKSENKNVGD